MTSQAPDVRMQVRLLGATQTFYVSLPRSSPWDVFLDRAREVLRIANHTPLVVVDGEGEEQRQVKRFIEDEILEIQQVEPLKPWQADQIPPGMTRHDLYAVFIRVFLEPYTDVLRRAIQALWNSHIPSPPPAAMIPPSHSSTWNNDRDSGERLLFGAGSFDFFISNAHARHQSFNLMPVTSTSPPEPLDLRESADNGNQAVYPGMTVRLLHSNGRSTYVRIETLSGENRDYRLKLNQKFQALSTASVAAQCDLQLQVVQIYGRDPQVARLNLNARSAIRNASARAEVLSGNLQNYDVTRCNWVLLHSVQPALNDPPTGLLSEHTLRGCIQRVVTLRNKFQGHVARAQISWEEFVAHINQLLGVAKMVQDLNLPGLTQALCEDFLNAAIAEAMEQNTPLTSAQRNQLRQCRMRELFDREFSLLLDLNPVVRSWAISEVVGWCRAGDSDASAIFIKGGVGAGKSTTLAQLWSEGSLDNQVVIWHVCQAQYQSTLCAVSFVRNLQQELFDHPDLSDYREYLAGQERILGGERSNATSNLQRCLGELRDEQDLGKINAANAMRVCVLEPLRAAQRPPQHNLFIVVDALDESEVRSTQMSIRRLLVDSIGEFPPWLRLIATSRPDDALNVDWAHDITIGPESTNPEHRKNNETDVESFVNQTVNSHSSYIAEQFDHPLQRMLNAARTATLFGRYLSAEDWTSCVQAVRWFGATSHRIRAYIARCISAASRGNMLYARQVLNQWTAANHVSLLALHSLPPNLGDLYRDFVCRKTQARPGYWGHARLLLEVLLASSEPISREELFELVRTVGPAIYGQVEHEHEGKMEEGDDEPAEGSRELFQSNFELISEFLVDTPSGVHWHHSSFADFLRKGSPLDEFQWIRISPRRGHLAFAIRHAFEHIGTNPERNRRRVALVGVLARNEFHGLESGIDGLFEGPFGGEEEQRLTAKAAGFSDITENHWEVDFKVLIAGLSNLLQCANHLVEWMKEEEVSSQGALAQAVRAFSAAHPAQKTGYDDAIRTNDTDVIEAYHTAAQESEQPQLEVLADDLKRRHSAIQLLEACSVPSELGLALVRTVFASCGQDVTLATLIYDAGAILEGTALSSGMWFVGVLPSILMRYFRCMVQRYETEHGELVVDADNQAYTAFVAAQWLSSGSYAHVHVLHSPANDHLDHWVQVLLPFAAPVRAGVAVAGAVVGSPPLDVSSCVSILRRCQFLREAFGPGFDDVIALVQYRNHISQSMAGSREKTAQFIASVDTLQRIEDMTNRITGIETDEVRRQLLEIRRQIERLPGAGSAGEEDG
jgi:hypothetical protein